MGGSLPFDAPLCRWLPAISELRRERAPAALMLSHRDVVSSGDAFADPADPPWRMHPDDRGSDIVRASGLTFGDPSGAAIVARPGGEVPDVPGHTSGRAMLRLPDEGRTVPTGDKAVGPGPERGPDARPGLRWPKMDDATGFAAA